jgi:hypothetical protein
VSCSVHDAIALEDRGIPTVAIHTNTFLNSAVAHARAYARPDFRSLSVPAPIANVSAEDVRRKAEGVIDEVIAVLTTEALGS